MRAPSEPPETSRGSFDESTLPVDRNAPGPRISSPSLSTQRSVLSAIQAEPLTKTAEPVPRYRDERELGRGGMGRVRRVFDADLNRHVAMKTQLQPKHGIGQFVAEAQLGARLEHPNVLPIYDVGLTSSDELYFTMKYVEDHDSLGQIIQQLKVRNPAYVRRYTFERRAQIVQQVCNALALAHEQGICHRDIKPDNIIVGTHGEVYLADWGVAGERTEDNPVHDELVGTPRYMSPERLACEARRYDEAGDIYALSAVLYELLTLRYYVDGAGKLDAQQLLLLLRSGRSYVEAKHFVNPVHGSVPPALSHIVKKGLSLAAEERFQSARELEAALQRWLEGRAPVACPRTAIQSALYRYNRFLDRHLLLGPVVTTIAALVVLASLVYTVVTLVSS